MKNQFLKIGLVATALFFSLASCKKDECHDCHYDFNETEVELGEQCGDALKTLEADGFALNGETYEVHCHAH